MLMCRWCWFAVVTSFICMTWRIFHGSVLLKIFEKATVFHSIHQCVQMKSICIVQSTHLNFYAMWQYKIINNKSIIPKSSLAEFQFFSINISQPRRPTIVSTKVAWNLELFSFCTLDVLIYKKNTFKIINYFEIK